MGKKIYRHGVFSSMYLCVDVVMHFVMGLVTMIYHKK
jgi:hypothetical protein